MKLNQWKSNLRFEAAKKALLDSLPETYTPLDKEFALSDFYVSWVKQEETRMREYDAYWSKQNWANILLGTRLWWQKLFHAKGEYTSS